MTSTFWISWEVRKPSKKLMNGREPLIAAKWATPPRSMTSWTLDSAKRQQPVARADITSWWSPKMFSAWLAKARAATWNTPGRSSPATLYMFGIMRRKPWDAVYVVVKAPACKEPWNAPAAPASDCISTTLTLWPKMFFMPAAAQSSTCSAIGEDGVIG